jgi:hypothetical protein
MNKNETLIELEQLRKQLLPLLNGLTSIKQQLDEKLGAVQAAPSTSKKQRLTHEQRVNKYL